MSPAPVPTSGSWAGLRVRAGVIAGSVEAARHPPLARGPYPRESPARARGPSPAREPQPGARAPARRESPALTREPSTPWREAPPPDARGTPPLEGLDGGDSDAGVG